MSTVSVFSLTLFVASCGLSTTQSGIKTVDITNSKVKWQSIGNCWSYAAIGWAESLVMIGNPGAAQPNFSESYITYRHYEEQLLADTSVSSKEVETGGWFEDATTTMTHFGLISEGDFIAEESEKTKSASQSDATDYLNLSMKSGPLSKSRTPEIVKAELNAAFKVNPDFESKLVYPKDLVTARATDGKALRSLAQEIESWKGAGFPKNRNSMPSDSTPAWSGASTAEQKAMFQRVKRALNDGHPVIMDWFVDFNALDTVGAFSLEKLQEMGTAGRQGYHSTVLEDYSVKGINPANNMPFEIGDGAVSPELKELALNYGDVTALIVKNSWGGNERLDRPSYYVGASKGFHKLRLSYLLGWMPFKKEAGDTSNTARFETPIRRFVLPAGY